jgi:acetylornithine deacetylase
MDMECVYMPEGRGLLGDIRGGVVLEMDYQSIVAGIDDAEVIELACNLIRIPSPTEAEQEAMEFVERLLSDEGIESYRQEIEPGRFQIIGKIPGNEGASPFMLNGHMDNDSVTASWQWDPYEPRIDGNRLWGAGIHNMKSGVAAILAAAIAIKRSGIKLTNDLLVAVVAGELQGGKGTLHMLRSGVIPASAIIPEPYSVERIITKCSGVHKCSITTIGKSVHTSRSDSGVDAIQKMLSVIATLKAIDFGVTDPDLPALPKLLVASIIGGRGWDYDLAGPSNLSDVCTCIIDVRYPPGLSSEDIDECFRSHLRTLQEGDLDLRWEYSRPPDPRFRVGGDMPPMDNSPDSRIVPALQECHLEVTGAAIAETGVILPYSYTGNDTAHLRRAGVDCCLYGPRGYPDEVEKHVRIDEMLTCARVLTRVALRYCHVPAGVG